MIQNSLDFKPNEIANKLRSVNSQKADLIFCERFDEKSTIWNTTEHSHEYMELIYFLEGKATIHGTQDELSISVFDALIYPENIMHQESVDFSKHQEIVVLGIKFEKPTNIQKMFSLTDSKSRLKWLFCEIHRQNKKHECVIVCHLMQILINYVRQYCEEGFFKKQNRIERVKQYIHNNFTHHITLDELAAIACVSPSYLNRIFRGKTNQTPVEYLNWIRIKAAMYLLATENISISQISERVGISDSKYFSRLFHKHTELSPRAYRLQQSKILGTSGMISS